MQRGRVMGVVGAAIGALLASGCSSSGEEQCAAPEITVSPGEVAAGESFTVKVTHAFSVCVEDSERAPTPEEWVSFVLTTSDDQEVPLGAVEPAADGHAALSAKLPDDVTAGAGEVSVAELPDAAPVTVTVTD